MTGAHLCGQVVCVCMYVCVWGGGDINPLTSAVYAPIHSNPFDTLSSLYCVYRYWEAIRHWDLALELTPEWAELHEMKAQVSMCLCGWMVLVGMASSIIHRPSSTKSQHPYI